MNLTQSFIMDAMRTNNAMAGTYSNETERQVIHALLGVVDETHELLSATDSVNMMEELGDLRWFLALYQHATGRTLNISTATADLSRIDQWTHDLVSAAKRIFAYGEKLDKHQATIEQALCGLATTLIGIVNKHNNTRYAYFDADAVVINKLRARFPDKFTQEHASNRDLGYEREVLRQTVDTCHSSSESGSYSGGSCGSFD